LKPLVARKLGRIMTLRQLVPASFLVSLTASAVAGLWWPPAALLATGILGSYAGLILVCAFRSLRAHGARVAGLLAAVFPVLHVSYGVGFLRGVVDHVLGLNPRVRDATAVSLSR